MKVICIDNKNWYSLTLGKIYDAYSLYGKKIEYGSYENNDVNWLRVTNDKGTSIRYPRELFHTLEEAREEKLEKLGIV